MGANETNSKYLSILSIFLQVTMLENFKIPVDPLVVTFIPSSDVAVGK